MLSGTVAPRCTCKDCSKRLAYHGMVRLLQVASARASNVLPCAKRCSKNGSKENMQLQCYRITNRRAVKPSAPHALLKLVNALHAPEGQPNQHSKQAGGGHQSAAKAGLAV